MRREEVCERLEAVALYLHSTVALRRSDASALCVAMDTARDELRAVCVAIAKAPIREEYVQ